MKILLDTCCIIWAVSEPLAISKNARLLLAAEESEVYVSVISAAEIACAVERERIVIDRHWKNWFRHYIDLNCWQVQNISLEIMEEAYSLPEAFHADPADRIIAATARLNNFTILTADKKIRSYPHVKTLW
ncbi:type II toxin-antitoxin system VapC family toxin [Desulfosarcina ovata]|uniref:PIN domain-containing protein n=1 Tax=Desulfosarcina ovata subsp. ovata TaxID=2752305 RepID=A0A5K8AJK0_9BACT|nr:type II toxin-antitoxin system VapC family toxin [Desulfosarcina ovata]BBO92885.1 PIN domain-containing protein [Desulfosarcina ovata subsp. ovata]